VLTLKPTVEHIKKQSTMETAMQWQQHHEVATHCKHGNTGSIATVSHINAWQVVTVMAIASW